MDLATSDPYSEKPGARSSDRQRPNQPFQERTSFDMTSHKFIKSSQPWPVFAMSLALLASGVTVQAQSTADEQVVFNLETTPDPQLNDFLFGISADREDDIWATGSFATGALALHFNGAKWTAVPMALEFTADMKNVSVLNPDDIWAVGTAFNSNTQHNVSVIEHFDGKNWSVVTSPHFANGDQLFDVKAIAEDDVFAVGESNSDSQKPRPLIEHFDGTSWKVVPAPVLKQGQTLSLGHIAATSHSDVWVTGSSEPVEPAIMHFDGAKFSNVPFPSLPDSALAGLAAIAPNDAWVVGAQRNGNDEATQTAHWNGKIWQIVPSPNLTHTNALRAISATSSSDIWAVGCTSCGADLGVNQVILAEHWDGKQWTINPTPLIGKGAIPGGVLTFPSGNVYIAGTAVSSSQKFHTLVLHATDSQ
jgi:hypothetical protein